MIDVHYDKNDMKNSNMKIHFDNLMDLVDEWNAITEAIVQCASVMYVSEENRDDYIEKTKILLGASLLNNIDTESVINEVKNNNIPEEGE